MSTDTETDGIDLVTSYKPFFIGHQLVFSPERGVFGKEMTFGFHHTPDEQRIRTQLVEDVEHTKCLELPVEYCIRDATTVPSDWRTIHADTVVVDKFPRQM